MTTSKTPAERLMGLELVDGWTVFKEVDKPDDFTGGYFSHGYIAKAADGRQAYVKAIDLTLALHDEDFMHTLKILTEAYDHELNLCRRCRRLSRVVNILADGKVNVDPSNLVAKVPYLVFELADTDVRSMFDATKIFDLAWTLRSLHHIAIGLRQLHQSQIAHQDLKPSNVLVFKDAGSKIADLGRSAAKMLISPHDNCSVPCALSYAPPELLYGMVNPDWNKRRFGCDAYLLGSMVVFYFARVAMTPLMLKHLDLSYHPQSLGGPYIGTYAEALPYIKEAFASALDQFIDETPTDLTDNLTSIIQQLCEPDPSLRGHPSNRKTNQNQYSLERYVSMFNLLATRVELKLVGRG